MIIIIIIIIYNIHNHLIIVFIYTWTYNSLQKLHFFRNWFISWHIHSISG